jgi:predicted SprT family Zn-dependent metalloprotease
MEIIDRLNGEFSGDVVLIISSRRCSHYHGHRTATFSPPNMVIVPNKDYITEKIMMHEFAHYLHYREDEITYCLEAEHGPYFKKYLDLITQ